MPSNPGGAPRTHPRVENDVISVWLLESEKPGFEPRRYRFLAVQYRCLVPLMGICSSVKRVPPRSVVRAWGG